MPHILIVVLSLDEEQESILFILWLQVRLVSPSKLYVLSEDIVRPCVVPLGWELVKLRDVSCKVIFAPVSYNAVQFEPSLFSGKRGWPADAD